MKYIWKLSLTFRVIYTNLHQTYKILCLKIWIDFEDHQFSNSKQRDLWYEYERHSMSWHTDTCQTLQKQLYLSVQVFYFIICFLIHQYFLGIIFMSNHLHYQIILQMIIHFEILITRRNFHLTSFFNRNRFHIKTKSSCAIHKWFTCR